MPSSNLSESSYIEAYEDMKHRPAKLFTFKSMIEDFKIFSLIMRAICKYAIGIIFLLEFRRSDVSSLKVVGDFCSV